MKVRKIHITVKPWSQVWEKERTAPRRLDRGGHASEITQETLYFDSVDELRQVLTDKRLELLD